MMPQAGPSMTEQRPNWPGAALSMLSRADFGHLL
jgi:hypothetical protein